MRGLTALLAAGLMSAPAHPEEAMKPDAPAFTAALAARERGFAGFSAARLGFRAEEPGVSVRLDDMDDAKALSCERRGGSKSEIKRAYRALAAALRQALPPRWTLKDQGDVLEASTPDGALAARLAWDDRMPSWLTRLWWRGSLPSADERYVLDLTVYPPERARK